MTVERRYGIAGRAAGEAALKFGAGRKATDAFVISRIARAVVDALDADDQDATTGRALVDRMFELERGPEWEQALAELRAWSMAAWDKPASDDKHE